MAKRFNKATMKIEVKNLKGEKTGEIELNQEVFGLEINEKLIHQVYVSQYANQREVLAHTKGRGERAGSGKKPWSQKGTGRARTGSVRNPIWRKGGIIFGPKKDRNFSKKINKKMRQLAIKMVLSGKVRDKELIIVENNKFENNKTREAADFIKKANLKGTILWAFDKAEKENSRASRNIEKVDNVSIDSLNIFNMLNRKYLIASQEGIKKLEEKYGKKSKTELSQ